MKLLAYLIILSLAFVAPVTRVDIAKLQPVEAVALYLEDGLIAVQTDEGSIGRGETVDAAVADLKENAISIIYLDTARYLLVAQEAEAYVPQMREYLKKSVKQGAYFGIGVKEEAQYLDAHRQSEKPKAGN